MRRVFPQSPSPRHSSSSSETDSDLPTARLPLCVKRYRRRALLDIKTAATHAEKQQIIDTYLYHKIRPDRQPQENCALIQAKLLEMMPCLLPVDAEQLSARCQYFVRHIDAVIAQKQQLLLPQNTAAETAARAEQASDHQESMAVVQEHMLKAVKVEQGPMARLQALACSRKEVEAILAFPTSPTWHEDLDTFMHRQARLACRNSPGHSQEVADELNSVRLEDVTSIADRHFYNKIVASWSAASNQRHLANELQVLMPQLYSVAAMQRVQARVEFFISHMTQICKQKGQDQTSHMAQRSSSAAERNKSKSSWRLIVHDDDSEHYATFLVL